MRPSPNRRIHQETHWRACKSVGDQAASAGIGAMVSLAAMAGYHVTKVFRSVPSGVWVQVCRSRWAPVGAELRSLHLLLLGSEGPTMRNRTVRNRIFSQISPS